MPTLQRLRLEVKEAGTVDPATLQQAFAIWIHYNMATRFCMMGKTYSDPKCHFVMFPSGSNLFFMNNSDGVFRGKNNWIGPAGTIDIVATDGGVELILNVGKVNLSFWTKAKWFKMKKIPRSLSRRRAENAFLQD